MIEISATTDAIVAQLPEALIHMPGVVIHGGGTVTSGSVISALLISSSDLIMSVGLVSLSRPALLHW